MIVKFKLFENSIINEEIDNEIAKYSIGDLVELKGRVPGTLNMNFDYEIGEVINVIYLYNTVFYDIYTTRRNLIMRDGNILRTINGKEGIEEVKRKKEEYRLKNIEIDPFGEEDWED